MEGPKEGALQGRPLDALTGRGRGGTGRMRVRSARGGDLKKAHGSGLKRLAGSAAEAIADADRARWA